MILEFTTTATVRPELINKTYSSFTTNLKGIDFEKSTLYINIDPLPATGRPHDVIDVAKKYFGHVVPQVPHKANFCQAVKWCFTQPKNPYFFHLEDDWQLNEEVNVDDLRKILYRTPNTAHAVTLRAYSFKSVADKRICLSPSLYKTSFASWVGKRLNPHHNPEKQLRNKTKSNPIGGLCKWARGVQYPSPKNRIIVKDIGRDWLEENNLEKSQTKEGHFISWRVPDAT